MEILEAIEYAENEVSKSGTTPRGTLRINCVTGFAYHVLSRHLPAFLSKHPQISVELFVTDRVVDLLEENTDIGIRSGEVTSPNVVCRKIASYQRYIYASPEYLARRGAPKAPEDLAGHDCIVHRSKEHYKWPFLRDGAVTEHEIASKLVVDTAEAAFQFALEGGGITRIANFFADEAVRRGALVSLLEDFHAPDIVEISAIYHAVRYRHRMPKVRAFIDYLLENVQGYDKRSPPRDKR